MKSKKIFWGIILMFFGTLLLLENFNIIEFAWSQIWRFWPVVLILIGVNIISAKTNPKIGIPLVALFTIIVLGILTYKGLQTPTEKQNCNLDFFGNNADEDIDEPNTKKLTKYTEDYDTRYNTATLIINGAAGSFNINNSTNQLFEANVKGLFKKFMLKKTESDTGVTLELNNNKSGNNTFKSNRLSDIEMALNANPIWNIEANIGAGEMVLDLTNYKVSNAKLKGGATAFEITLGNKYKNTNLVAETGVSSVEIKVPESSGCQIFVKSGLSSKDFEGFTNFGKGLYQTPNFNKASNKINISLKGGLSRLEVIRY